MRLGKEIETTNAFDLEATPGSTLQGIHLCTASIRIGRCAGLAQEVSNVTCLSVNVARDVDDQGRIKLYELVEKAFATSFAIISRGLYNITARTHPFEADQ